MNASYIAQLALQLVRTQDRAPETLDFPDKHLDVAVVGIALPDRFKLGGAERGSKRHEIYCVFIQYNHDAVLCAFSFGTEFMKHAFYLNGETFDLSHLNDRSGYTAALLGNTTKRVKVEVSFSCHCWSRLPVDGEAIPLDRFVADGSRETPRNRIFCEQRHEMSKALPFAIDEMLAGDGHVSKTLEHNILRVEQSIPVVANDHDIKYFIFLHIEKKEPEGKQKYIKLFVETAYPESALYKKVIEGKPFNLSKLVGDCWKYEYTGRK